MVGIPIAGILQRLTNNGALEVQWIRIFQLHCGQGFKS